MIGLSSQLPAILPNMILGFILGYCDEDLQGRDEKICEGMTNEQRTC